MEKSCLNLPEKNYLLVFPSHNNHYAVVSVLQKSSFTSKMFIPIDLRFNYMKQLSTVQKHKVKTYLLKAIC